MTDGERLDRKLLIWSGEDWLRGSVDLDGDDDLVVTQKDLKRILQFVGAALLSRIGESKRYNG
jgi:hypothetical protein